MDRFIVTVKVAKSGTPDTYMTGKRTVASTSLGAVLQRVTTELDKMEPVEEDPNGKS